MNSYDLSRAWFDWSFENPEKIKPNHTALYFFCIEHCNRMGWKKNFGLPTTMAKEAIGISSYNTYKNTLNDLVEWGFIKMIQSSKNQFSSNIIALSNFDKATDKALDKAFIKHGSKQGAKQSESTVQSTGSIDKQETIEQGTIKQETKNNILVYPFNSENFMNVWNKLIIQKKWKRKSHDALQASLFQMKDVSESDAIEMMTNSIAGDWQGIFPLKNKINGKQDSNEERRKELLAKYAN